MVRAAKTLNRNHYLFKSAPKIQEIVNVFEQNNIVKFLNYYRQYDYGEFFDLSSQTEWCDNFCANYLKPENAIKRLNTGVNYWEKNTNQNINEIAEDARNNFDIDARIEFIYRNEKQKCYHVYSFYSNRKNADKAYRFYDMHSTKLLKFISHFNYAAAHLIAEADKPENRIQIPSYIPLDVKNIKRDYVAEMKAVNAGCALSDREFEVILLYAAGCTAQQIADMFHRSSHTVIAHIKHIHAKTGCKDRKELNVYVHDHGWNGLERFFFSYIPDMKENESLDCGVH